MKVPKLEPLEIPTKKEKKVKEEKPQKPKPKASKKQKSEEAPKKRMLSEAHLQKLRDGRQRELEAKKKAKENSD